MRSLCRALAILGFGLVVLLVPSVSAMAAETFSSELVIITEEDTVGEDVYAVANRILVRGVIDGDLIALAGQDIRIEGEVTGSVLAIAPEVVVTGEVGGSLRTAAPSVEVSGSIGGDIFTGAGRFEITESGGVGRDVVVWAWNAFLAGEVSGDIEGTQRSTVLAGEVEGDVRISVNRLRIEGALLVEGDLGYRSGSEATGLENADVGGAVVRQEPVAPNIRIRALGLVLRVLIAVALSSIALLMAWASPERIENARKSLVSMPLRALGAGAMVVGSPLIVIGVGALIYGLAPTSAAIPLLAALVPLVLGLFGLLLVISLVAGIPMVAWIGARLRKDTTIAGAVALGALAVSVMWMVPFLGWVVALVVPTAGLGGWINSLRGVH